MKCEMPSHLGGNGQEWCLVPQVGGRLSCANPPIRAQILGIDVAHCVLLFAAMSGSTSSTQSLSGLPLSGLLCAAAAFSLAVTGACAVGEVPMGDGQRIPSGDPAVEARLDGLDIICESTLIVTGTFVEGIAQPAELLGCWPVGTWTVSATIDRLGCRSHSDSEFTDIYRQLAGRVAAQMYWQGEVIPGEIAFRAV